jgi:hypothetical protein
MRLFIIVKSESLIDEKIVHRKGITQLYRKRSSEDIDSMSYNLARPIPPEKQKYILFMNGRGRCRCFNGSKTIVRKHHVSIMLEEMLNARPW